MVFLPDDVMTNLTDIGREETQSDKLTLGQIVGIAGTFTCVGVGVAGIVLTYKRPKAWVRNIFQRSPTSIQDTDLGQLERGTGREVGTSNAIPDLTEPEMRMRAGAPPMTLGGGAYASTLRLDENNAGPASPRAMVTDSGDDSDAQGGYRRLAEAKVPTIGGASGSSVHGGGDRTHGAGTNSIGAETGTIHDPTQPVPHGATLADAKGKGAALREETGDAIPDSRPSTVAVPATIPELGGGVKSTETGGPTGLEAGGTAAEGKSYATSSGGAPTLQSVIKTGFRGGELSERPNDMYLGTMVAVNDDGEHQATVAGILADELEPSPVEAGTNAFDGPETKTDEGFEGVGQDIEEDANVRAGCSFP
ncbi:hypothetical protein K491DRAFT_722836 [Lophiostoma macrostomum CBS 122681]|uniref:Uncharacterized protein n=1 Tax=Lophiostoma macrostomum CBS 122681 TaxID=1314788 RepID=A0A6A6SM96_9PLEO|nr:hypothetical protein K491DRAFT_722836 [Lophiostoma macrostomum CBS 122681]